MDFSCWHLMAGVAIWFSNLTHLLSCVWFLCDLVCGFSVCLTCVGGHSFSHSMNTHESLVRFDGLLDSFSCRLGWVYGHVSRASLLVHDFVLLMLLLVLLMIGPLRASRRFVLIITLAPFFKLISHGMLLRETQRLHFRTKFCILLTLMISWVHICCIQVLGSQVLID
jgi:hypothetical protein